MQLRFLKHDTVGYECGGHFPAAVVFGKRVPTDISVPVSCYQLCELSAVSATHVTAGIAAAGLLISAPPTLSQVCKHPNSCVKSSLLKYLE